MWRAITIAAAVLTNNSNVRGPFCVTSQGLPSNFDSMPHTIRNAKLKSNHQTSITDESGNKVNGITRKMKKKKFKKSEESIKSAHSQSVLSRSNDNHWVSKSGRLGKGKGTKSKKVGKASKGNGVSYPKPASPSPINLVRSSKGKVPKKGKIVKSSKFAKFKSEKSSMKFHPTSTPVSTDFASAGGVAIEEVSSRTKSQFLKESEGYSPRPKVKLPLIGNSRVVPSQHWLNGM